MEPLRSNEKGFLCPGCGVLQGFEAVLPTGWAKCSNCGADILVRTKVKEKKIKDDTKRNKITPLSKRWIRRSDNTAINKVIDNPNCSFLGVQSDQPFTAFYVWEKFFLKYGKKMQRFIEFGCDTGGTSVYFALQCLNLEAQYIGFDRRKPEVYKNNPTKRLVQLHKKMVYGNGYEKAKQIKHIIQDDGRTVIFADCIDKPWEFKMFAPMLKSGDILAMHDWDRAIKDEWVEPETMVALTPYRLLYEEERLGLNTLTKFFLKE